jgi:hypothetical protein
VLEVIAWPLGQPNPVCVVGPGETKINVLVSTGSLSVGSELRLVHTPRGPEDWSYAVLSFGIEFGGIDLGFENLSYVDGSQVIYTWIAPPAAPFEGWVHRLCLPPDTSLVGERLVAQAALIDPTLTYPNATCLSRALILVLEPSLGGTPCTPTP